MKVDKDKYILIILLFFYAILLSGCKDDRSFFHGNDGLQQNDETNISKAGYVESELNLPDKSEEIYSIKIRQDSSVELLNNKGLYTSQDAGYTWSKVKNINMTDFSNVYLGDINDNGDVFLFTSNSELITIDSNDGTSRILNVKLSNMQDGKNNNLLTTAKFTSNGNIIGLDLKNSIIILDAKSGNISKEIKSDGSFREAVDNVGDLILTQTDNGVKIYDLEGSIQESNEIINKIFEIPNINFKVSKTSSTLVSTQVDGKGFFACNKKGIFHYYFGGNVSEQIINGSLYSLGNAEYSIQSMGVLADDSFIVLLKHNENGFVIKCYKYSEESKFRSSNEINIYSLYENETIRQNISMYNSHNSGNLANYIVGIDDKNALTESDAIKTLNTSIMAGSGPDLIILDGMSVNNYIEKGILININDVVKEVNSEEKLFDGVSKAYSFDGNTYAIAARYLVPLLIGDLNVLNNINDLDTLAIEVAKLKSKYPEMQSIIGLYNQPLLTTLYNISAGTWINSDGSIDELKIENYFGNIKKIQDIQLENVDKNNIQKLEENFIASPNPELDQMLNVRLGEQKLAITEMGTFNYFNMMPSIMDEAGVTYKFLGEDKKGIFIPRTVIGISSKSNNIEGAKEFLKQVLSSDFQASEVGDGFPVNQRAFDKLMERQMNVTEGEVAGAVTNENSDGNNNKSAEKLKREMLNLKSIINSLKISSLTDNIIKSTVIDEGMKLLKNESTLDNAVSNVMRKVNLYLLE